MFHDDVEHIIMTTIESLPEQCRKVIMMSRFNGLSHREIAMKLGISIKGVEFHITRALKSLREELKDYLPGLMWFAVFLSTAISSYFHVT
jgi:RNA polymerase sigma-70 factor (ECF subfamily)